MSLLKFTACHIVRCLRPALPLAKAYNLDFVFLLSSIVCSTSSNKCTKTGIKMRQKHSLKDTNDVYLDSTQVSKFIFTIFTCVRFDSSSLDLYKRGSGLTNRLISQLH